MTTIGTVTVTTPYVFNRRGYAVTLASCVTEDEFVQMRELFAKAEYGTAIHAVPGTRPFGEDLTADSVNTVYITWTVGTSSKPQNGYYLLRPGFSYVDDETPEGHNYIYTIRLFFLGTLAFYTACYACLDLEVVDSDWGI